MDNLITHTLFGATGTMMLTAAVLAGPTIE